MRAEHIHHFGFSLHGVHLFDIERVSNIYGYEVGAKLS